jgi:hypothetical protein
MGGVDLDKLDEETASYGVNWREIVLDRVAEAAIDTGAEAFLNSLS